MPRCSPLLTVLVAVFCAVAWMPTHSPGADAGVAAGESVGVLPGRRQGAANPELELDDDGDDAPCAPVEPNTTIDVQVESACEIATPHQARFVAGWWSVVQARGPPAIA